MQKIKDSFYAALRDRLAVIDPARTVTIRGELRPAVVTEENETATAAQPEPEVFYLTWKGASVEPEFASAKRPLLRLQCEVEYSSEGTEGCAGTDRGRSIGAMDSELRQMLSPSSAAVKDFTQTPAVETGGVIF